MDYLDKIKQYPNHKILDFTPKAYARKEALEENIFAGPHDNLLKVICSKMNCTIRGPRDYKFYVENFDTFIQRFSTKHEKPKNYSYYSTPTAYRQTVYTQRQEVILGNIFQKLDGSCGEQNADDEAKQGIIFSKGLTVIFAIEI